MAITFSLDTPDLTTYVTEMYGITEKAVKRAEIRAINKTLQWLASQIARNLSADLGLAQKKVRQRIRLSYANQRYLAGEFWLGVYDVSLIRFGRGRAVGKGYKVKDRFVKGGFLARMKNGHEGVFVRKGRARLPIKEKKEFIKLQATEQINRLFNRAELELKKRLKTEYEAEMRRAMGAF